MKDKGVNACIPGCEGRKKAIRYDKRRYTPRNRIEIMLAKLKDWRPGATRYDRCFTALIFEVALAAGSALAVKLMSLDPAGGPQLVCPGHARCAGI